MQITKETQSAIKKSNKVKGMIADVFGVSVQSVDLWLKDRKHPNFVNLDVIKIYETELAIPQSRSIE
jgi:DNA-binding transcriptional regulator YiaG